MQLSCACGGTATARRVLVDDGSPIVPEDPAQGDRRYLWSESRGKPIDGGRDWLWICDACGAKQVKLDLGDAALSVEDDGEYTAYVVD